MQLIPCHTSTIKELEGHMNLVFGFSSVWVLLLGSPDRNEDTDDHRCNVKGATRVAGGFLGSNLMLAGFCMLFLHHAFI